MFSKATVVRLTLCMPFPMLFLSSVDFSLNFLKKIFQKTLSECQMSWNQMRTNILFGLGLGPNCLKMLLANGYIYIVTACIETQAETY